MRRWSNMPSQMSRHPAALALTRRGWAWEFLRRNPEYRRLYDDTRSLGCRSAAGAARIRRWGLMFRGGPGP